MGIIPDWVKEFPGQLWATFKENAKENLPEFRDEIVSGAKAVLQVPGKVVTEIVKPVTAPLIIIGVIGLLVLLFWKKISPRIL